MSETECAAVQRAKRNPFIVCNARVDRRIAPKRWPRNNNVAHNVSIWMAWCVEWHGMAWPLYTYIASHDDYKIYGLKKMQPPRSSKKQ